MKYLALSIGGIYKTLENTTNIYEMWEASYFFSYLTKRIIQKLLNKNINTKDFIIPYLSKINLEEKKGIGFFPNKIIFKSNTIDKQELRKIINELLKEIENKSNKALSYEFLKNYLQFYIIEIEKEYKNPIVEINKYLESGKLFYQAQLFSENLLLKYISSRKNFEKIKEKFLVKEAFEKIEDVKHLSLPKIALNITSGNIENEVEVIKKIIEIKKDKIKLYNRYITKVEIKVERSKEILEEIGKDDFKLKEFFKCLFEFSLEAISLIKNFGGEVIYAGGEKVLFFAPLRKEKENIFELCNKINNSFISLVDNNLNSILEKKKATLFFGININYYTFYPYEVKENVNSLFSRKIKKESKTHIGYRVVNQNGQVLEDVFCINKSFKELLNLLKIDNSIDLTFLEFLVREIGRHRGLLNNIKNDHNKIREFYKNNFKNVDKKEEKIFLRNLEKFTIEAFKEKKEVDSLFNALRVKNCLGV